MHEHRLASLCWSACLTLCVLTSVSCRRQAPAGSLALGAVCIDNNECSTGHCEASRCVEGAGENPMRIDAVRGDSDKALSALVVTGDGLDFAESAALVHQNPAASVPLAIRSASVTPTELTADLLGQVSAGQTYTLQLSAPAGPVTRDVTVIAGAQGAPGPTGPGVTQIEVPLPAMSQWVEGTSGGNPTFVQGSLIAENLARGAVAAFTNAVAGASPYFPVTNFLVFRLPLNAKVGTRIKVRALAGPWYLNGADMTPDGGTTLTGVGGDIPLTFVVGCWPAGATIKTGNPVWANNVPSDTDGEVVNSKATLPADIAPYAYHRFTMTSVDIDPTLLIASTDTWCSLKFATQPMNKIGLKLQAFTLVYTPAM